MTRDQIRQLVTTKLASRYWRQRDAEIIVAAMLHSGMTLSAFAREFGVCVQRLRRWRQRLSEVAVAGGSAPTLPSPAFHPVHVVVGDGDGPRAPAFELVVRGGRRIAVNADFDEGSLERLVRFAERLGC